MQLITIFDDIAERSSTQEYARQIFGNLQSANINLLPLVVSAYKQVVNNTDVVTLNILLMGTVQGILRLASIFDIEPIKENEEATDALYRIIFRHSDPSNISLVSLNHVKTLIAANKKDGASLAGMLHISKDLDTFLSSVDNMTPDANDQYKDGIKSEALYDLSHFMKYLNTTDKSNDSLNQSFKLYNINEILNKVELNKIMGNTLHLKDNLHYKTLYYVYGEGLDELKGKHMKLIDDTIKSEIKDICKKIKVEDDQSALKISF